MRSQSRSPTVNRSTLTGRALVAGLLLIGLAGCSTGGAAASDSPSLTNPATTATSTSTGDPTAGDPTTGDPTTGDPTAGDSTAGDSRPSSAVASAPVAAAPSDAQAENPDAPASVDGPLLLPASPPVAVAVPAIGINAPLIDLGRNADGTVEVPSLDDPDSKPGWYSGSPTPGELGPAIILGHVDSRQFGPGVFYALQDLRPGEGIDVTRADGTVAQFSIDSVQTVAKSEFPTLEVYGNLDHSGLRLITCGGAFDPAARSYEQNIIVYASLTGSRQA